ncbi:MAG TPA: flagellar biosynthesis protein FlhB [Symbiobacteriaceae bacterium]|nr:flagellar biosynthesis protein FlhB [Symbiobacteriaceae bacterium]
MFSEEKTEEASQRKLEQARKEGRVPKSIDLVSGFGLVAAAMTMKSIGPGAYEALAGAMTETFRGVGGQTNLTVESMPDLFHTWLSVLAKTFLPLAAAILAVGVSLTLLQTRFLVSTKQITPDFNRMNPVSGFTRLFSLRSVVDLFKALLKLGVVGFIAYSNMSDLLPQAPSLMSQPVALGVSHIAGRAVSVLQSVGFGIIAIGVLDYGYNYWEFQKSVRMTKQEVKQEHKDQEGKPEVKQKQRQRAREMARRRKAIKEVPTADVVITNPTHFAIAIKYDAGKDSAPRVVAKGVDLLAQRIKVLARQHEVPTVENRPLARSLYATVEIGKVVPPELYQAVAEVLAFVYNTRRDQRRRR